MKYLLILLLILPNLVKAQAPCEISVSSSPISPMCGGCVTLYAYGSGTGNIAFQEDFNSGSPTGWSFTQTADYSNPCSPGGVDGTPHMWMGDASVNPRDMETVGMDLSLGGSICFDMLYSIQGNASPCEGPDEPDEGVYLQYSTDGGATWTTITYFDPNGGNDSQLTNWNNYCFSLPAGALTSNTMIRWHQDAVSGPEYDHWGIDNVTIILNDPNFEVSWLHDGYAYGQGNGGGANPNQVCLTNDSTFTAQVSDGVNTCTASVTVQVTLPDVQVSAGPDTSVCAGECVDLSGFATVIVSPASTPTFENNEFSVVTGGNASININVQGLNTTSLTTGSITEVCINGFNFSGTQLCTTVSGCNCNGTPISFGGQCDLDISSFDVTLISPTGCQIVMVPNGVATGTDYQNVCFVPSGANINSGGFPASGSWSPDQPFSNLNGCDPNGVWTLDFNAPGGLGFGLGTLFGWSISFDDPEISYEPSYTWSPTTNMTNSNSLTPNVCVNGTTTYTLTASDTAGCVTVSDDVVISIEPTCCPLQIDSITSSDASCGLSNGDISIYASGNQGVINYSIDNGTTFQTTSLFSGLTAGTYDVVVQDDSCTLTQQVTIIDQPGPNIIQITPTDPSCGASDGVIDISASGGNGSLIYSIDNGATTQSSSSFTGLGAGSYNIVVEDALGCQAIGQISLNNSSAPVIDMVNVTEPTCGLPNGELDIVVSGGTGTISYSIDNGATYQSGTSLFTGLADGTYDIIVMDAGGCSSSTQATLAPSQGPVITNIVLTDPSCGVSNGTINIQVSNGLAPYSYSIDNGATTQANSFFSGLGSASYPIQIQDANGCILDSVIALNSAGGPVIDNVIVSDPDCATSNGQISVIASGGNGTLLYSINNGTSFQTGSNFTNVPSGNYTVVVQDANMCESSFSVSLNNFPGPTIDNVVTVDPSCGNTDGEIHIGATGTPTMLFSIDNGASFSNDTAYLTLPVGTYDIIVVDGNGCQAAQQVVLNNLAAPTIDNLIVSNPICGQNNGELEIIASGTPTLQYSLNGGGFGTNPVFSNLGAGSYNLTVTDGNGCQVSVQQALTFISGPQIDSTVVSMPLCYQSNDGFVSVYVSGGTPAYQFSLDNGATFQTGSMFANVVPGSYTLVVSDQNNCQSSSIIIVTEPLELTVDTSHIDATCYGECDGSALAFPQGGTSATGGYTYNWSGGIAGPTDAQASNVCAGTYFLTVTDDNGCSVSETFIIGQPDELLIDALDVTNEVCYQDCQGTITIASNGSQYSIDGGLSFSSANVFDSLCPGDYNIVIMDQLGCTTNGTTVVGAATELIADFSYSPTDLTAFDTYVEFTNLSNGGINFNWNFGGTGVSNNENPAFTFPDGVAEEYNVCLSIINAKGCQASVCHVVEIQPEFFMYVPNAFTPDGNGDNDEFYADGLGLLEVKFEMIIFDRWGKVVFEGNNAAYRWDGTYNGKPAPEDVYVWKITVDRLNSVGTDTYRGHVSLIR